MGYFIRIITEFRRNFRWHNRARDALLDFNNIQSGQNMMAPQQPTHASNSDKFKNSVKILNLKWTGNCGVGYGAEVF